MNTEKKQSSGFLYTHFLTSILYLGPNNASK